MNNLLQVGKLYKLTNSDSVFLVISDTNQKVEFVFIKYGNGYVPEIFIDRCFKEGATWPDTWERLRKLIVPL